MGVVKRKNSKKSDSSKTSAHLLSKMTKNRSAAFDSMNPKFWYIDGVAYDFEPFVKDHPGGDYAIYLAQGRECKALIYSYHMNVKKVECYLDKYRCPESEQVKNPGEHIFAPASKFTYEEDGFLMTVKREANKYFKETGKDPKAGFLGIFKFFLNIILMEVFMYYMCTNESYIAATLHGILRSIMVVQSTHGASHFAYSWNPSVNRWIYRIGTVMIGLWNPKVWDVQHVVAHHIYTNEWPYDTDSAFPIKSVAYNQRRFWYHKYQHFYAWFVYAFTIPLVFLNSLRDTIRGKQMLFRMNYQVPGSYLEAWLCTIFGFLYLILPYFYLPFWNAFWLALFSNVVSSLFFSLQFVVNHEVDFVMETGPIEGVVDWGQFQVDQSCSFAASSDFSTELAGGLNTQIEHHLFPGIYYGHYVALHEITKKVCKDFGITYNERPTLWGALEGHYNLLKNPPKSIR